MGLLPLLRDAHRAPSSFDGRSSQSLVTHVNPYEVPVSWEECRIRTRLRSSPQTVYSDAHRAKDHTIPYRPDITAHGPSWARDVEHDGQGSAHSFKCLWVVVPVLGAQWPSYHPPSRELFADPFSSAPKANTSAGRCPPWHSTVYYVLVMSRKPMSSLEIFSQSESIASPYAQSLNLGYAANCCFPGTRPHRDIFGDCLVGLVWTHQRSTTGTSIADGSTRRTATADSCLFLQPAKELKKSLFQISPAYRLNPCAKHFTVYKNLLAGICRSCLPSLPPGPR
ncbi:hypothetical protein BDP55DRAFT_186593 [Colletotrichum godetiae]|uniref:Uncharacterized protein n=1 Tax=Colletotrichum godetiae TaxID=1209918 RepID=A0AAJ0AJJ8_9PEZI|nr:uncharacterized protein BDP55DRAFT_186593 [Colletotrichum godetiae]KAK1674429.1 hypothetical protein BDP55DRAFT_186593 [Colletotrichum godetiae]